MTFRTERCLVGDNPVTLVTDFEGTVTMVICADYEYATGTCARLRRTGNSGPLTDFIQRVSLRSDSEKSGRCAYWPS